MGHETVVYRTRTAVIHDRDFEAIRHFLIIMAEATGLDDMMSFIRGWQHEGPGVWTGEDFDAFFHGDELLEWQFIDLLGSASAREAVREFRAARIRQKQYPRRLASSSVNQ